MSTHVSDLPNSNLTGGTGLAERVIHVGGPILNRTCLRPNSDTMPYNSCALTPRTIAIVNLLLENRDGLSSLKISETLDGVAFSSAFYQELNNARISAIRKQIQRSKRLLIQSKSSVRLSYCKTTKVWHVCIESPAFKKTNEHNFR